MPMINEVMHVFSRWASVVGLLVLPMLGCSDTGGGAVGGSSGSGGASGSGGTAGEGGTGGRPPVTMLTTTYEVLPGGDVRPLEGVRVCQMDTDNCVTSNEAGRVQLDLPANQETGYTAEKVGYGSFLTTFVTDETFPGSSSEPMHTHEQLEVIAGQLGVPYPWMTGVIGSFATPEVAGTTVALVGATGTPFYLDATGQYTSELDASVGGSWWPHPLGTAGFAGIPEGEQVVEFGGGAADCGPSRWGWPSDAPNRVRTPIRVGYMSSAAVSCDGP